MWFIMVIAISEPVYHLCCLRSSWPTSELHEWRTALVNLFNHLWKLIIFLLEHISIRKLQTFVFHLIWGCWSRLLWDNLLLGSCILLQEVGNMSIPCYPFLLHSLLQLVWAYGNRPLSQGWCKPCRVVEADLYLVVVQLLLLDVYTLWNGTERRQFSCCTWPCVLCSHPSSS